MRIALYSHHFPPHIGGSGVHAKLLADGFAALGHMVTVITATAASSVEDATYPFPLVRRPSFPRLCAALAWSDLVLEIGPCMKAGLLARAMGKPLVIAHPMFPATGMRGLATRALCAAVPNIAPSKAVADALSTRAVIPNPYDDGVFQKKAATEERARDVVFVGRLIKEKGLRNLLLALDLLRQRGLVLSLTIVGAGPEGDVCKEISRDLGLDNQVDFVGATPPARLAEIYNGHKIAVVPSICDEGFGLVALEAIACGCAVVGSGSGGLPEAIGPCGVTYPRTSIRDLAARLEQLVREPRLLDVMQSYAKEHLARHTRAAIAEEYLRFMADCFPALASAAPSLPNPAAADVELSGPVELPVRRTLGPRPTAESVRAHG